MSADTDMVERLWQLHRRGVSYASDKPAVNLLLADMAEGIRHAANRIEALDALGIGELVEAGTHALRELDCLAACIYHQDQREEVQAFADRFRAALSRARASRETPNE